MKSSACAAFVIALAACGAPGSLDAPAAPGTTGAGPAAAEKEGPLPVAGEIARSLAQHPELQRELHALLSSEKQVSYEQVRGLSAALPAATSKGPALLLSAPLGMSDKAAPLFTFVPDLPEKEVKELRYFAADGASFTLPASEKPDRPVVVVGPDERLPTSAAVEDVASLTSFRMAIGEVYITDDHEPWYKGDPEIYAICYFPAAGIPPMVLDLPEVNRTRTWYSINRLLGYYLASYGTPAQCGLSESDGVFDGNDGLGWREVWPATAYGTYPIPDGIFTITP